MPIWIPVKVSYSFWIVGDRPDAVYFDPAAHCVDRLYDADKPFYGAFCRAPHAAFAAKQVLPESPQKAA